MSEELIGVLTALVGAISGIIVKHFLDGWREKRAGLKNEAQRIAADRDHFRTLKFRWKKAYYQLVYIASRRGVTDDELPSTPDDDLRHGQG